MKMRIARAFLPALGAQCNGNWIVLLYRLPIGARRHRGSNRRLAVLQWIISRNSTISPGLCPIPQKTSTKSSVTRLRRKQNTASGNERSLPLPESRQWLTSRIPCPSARQCRLPNPQTFRPFAEALKILLPRALSTSYASTFVTCL